MHFHCQHVLPAVYDDSISYYELLCKVTNKINEIIKNDTSQIDSIKELQSLYINLKTYTENYLKHLDLQNEINQKLDEMGQSGDMARYLALYLNGLHVDVFKTKNDMKVSDTIGFGSICKTLGNTNHLTGDGHYYNVRRTLTTDSIDEDNIIALKNPELVAEKIPDYYIEELTNIIDSLSESVNSLNALHTSEVGDLNLLKTVNKNNLVTALNETTDKIPEVINEINNNIIGSLESLSTSDKSNIVNAINALKTHSDNITGSLEFLTTPNKNTLADAINSVNLKTIPIEQGGTGGTTASGARANLGVLTPTILFDNYSGADYPITIPEPCTNFQYLEIFYRDSDHIFNSSRFVPSSEVKVTLTVNNMGGANYYVKTTTIVASGNSITFHNPGWFYRENGNVVSQITDQNVKIRRIVGYRS